MTLRQFWFACGLLYLGWVGFVLGALLIRLIIGNRGPLPASFYVKLAVANLAMTAVGTLLALKGLVP